MHSIVHALLHISPLLVYLLVAVILLLESSGVPIINNTLLLLLGATASLGFLNLEMLMISAFLGSSAGACCAYWIGMRGGRKIVLRLLACSSSRFAYLVRHIALHWLDTWSTLENRALLYANIHIANHYRCRTSASTLCCHNQYNQTCY